jgi:membrane protease subunit HflK
MAWNAPGKNDKSENASQNNASRKPDAPPDLDEVLKSFQQKLRTLLGRKKVGLSNGPAASGPQNVFNGKPIISFIAVVFLLLWFFAGFFIVGPAEKAAVLRFGKYVGTEEPGLHWVAPFISSRTVVNVQQVLTFPYQAEMLTQDENIVSVDLVVQYRIYNLRDYLFTVSNANESLQQATASALRQVIGQTRLDDVLTSGREKVRQETQQVLEKTLERYQTGLIITDVNMQPAKPPEEVTAAFDDAIKAREDEQRFKNQATTYANRIVPAAQGNASRLMAEANAYKQRVVLDAQGATAQFLALLPQYQLSPQVMRERMYLDALQFVLGHSSKILVDTPQSNNMMYLPLDKLMKKSSVSKGNTQAADALNTNLQSQNQNLGPVSNIVPGSDASDLSSPPLLYPNRPSYGNKGGE